MFSGNRKMTYLKAGCVLVMAVYGIVCARDPTMPRFLDRVDLVIHEAGHLFFRWFGEFLQVCGGTIGQLFVPAAFTVYFFLRREFFSSSVTLFWCGQSLLNVSVYVKDAQAMVLPLVSLGGGENTVHDWNYILSRVGLLRWDHAIGNMVYLLGVLVMIAAVAWGSYSSVERGGSDENAGTVSP
jgi:hypothetical protein